MLKRMVLLILLLLCPLWSQADVMVDAAKLSHLLTYIASDYANAVRHGKIIDSAEYREMRELCDHAATLLQSVVTEKPLSDQVHRQLANRLLDLQAAIMDKRDGSRIAALTDKLNQQLSHWFDLWQPPQSTPELASANHLFVTHCASCHGIRGLGDGPLSKQLNIKPSNLTNIEHMHNLSLLALFNTISHGIPTRAMPATHEILSATERWSLAFYTLGLSIAPNQGHPNQLAAKPSINALLTTSLNEIKQTDGDLMWRSAQYWYTHPDKMFAQQPDDHWSILQSRLKESYDTYRTNHYDLAYLQAIDAYLTHFEPLEPIIDARSVTLRKTIETIFLNYRAAIKQRLDERVEHEYQALSTALTSAKQQFTANRLSAWGLFFSAYMILMREGLEIILLVGMLGMVINKAGRRDCMRYIHIGWLTALFAGVLTWFVSSTIIHISGASREMTEGVSALFASAILLYTGLWIHRQSASQNWQRQLKEKLAAQLSKRSLWGVTALSFLAVYREAFEIILFYQALLSQADHATAHNIVMGVLSAIGCLVILTFAIFRLGLRLPLKQFFQISKVAIFTLAFVLLGQGLHALEEAGYFPEYPVHMPTVAMLGIYPNIYVMSLQTSLLVMLLIVWWYKRTLRMAAARATR